MEFLVRLGQVPRNEGSSGGLAWKQGLEFAADLLRGFLDQVAPDFQRGEAENGDLLPMLGLGITKPSL